ncbi:hypothetical protein CL65_gp060 [Mycobacterium phage Patience]|uniref:Uncharacterized protein n=1 Tax=Mycobacterium phage Patience TaxID=1074308 RepID=G1JWH0_9CAUD|nr:hypothetical protein CL65_gp060 [Mycobacterium phage Patience]AEL97968.1 hypothetical protein PATIENCE_59 [Mycobacterium phage Patience]
MKYFVLEVGDDVSMADISAIMYLGKQHPEAPESISNTSTSVFSEIPGDYVRADGKVRLTYHQREALWLLCGRYNVPFRESDYPLYEGNAFGSKHMAEGWIGGPNYNGHNNMGQTIYVGVTKDGRVHS